ncbi:MAG: DUF4367 domain-containing protein [Ruminococcus sp.]|nr:DUF4367 domain-containing protein [Ruminococcus sp.]
MTDQELDDLILRAVRAYGSEYIDESELDDTPHIFSRRFERRMARILSGRVVWMPSRNISMKKRLHYYFIAAILLAFSALLLGAGVKLYDFFTFDDQGTHTNVGVSLEEGETLPSAEEPFQTYEITEGLEGFELECAFSDCVLNQYEYINDEFRFTFAQFRKEYYNATIDTEGYELVNQKINGGEGFYLDRNNELEGEFEKLLVWTQGAYTYELMIVPFELEKPSIGIDEMIVMAESIQPTDWDMIGLPYRLTSDRLELSWSMNRVTSCNAEYWMDTDDDMYTDYLVEFDWCSEEDFQPSFTTQNMVTVSVNDQEALYKYVPKLGKEYLMWSSDGSVFTIKTEIVNGEPLGENALIEMAESMQKRE